ncbi:MAG: fumarylacetoacetase [Acidimicrobiales bacterium]|nr:fumarylacetoacetase [Acidimicrobiales bacterium]
MSAETWAPVAAGSGFGVENLPYGVAAIDRGPASVVVRIGDGVLPVADAVPERLRPLVEQPTLNRFLAAGPATWDEVRQRLVAHLGDRTRERPLPQVSQVDLRLPCAVGDYVDFYSSIHHATNVGRLLRTDTDPLRPNWRHLPVGYHGRVSTIAPSGTPVVRPSGLVADGAQVVRRPTEALDYELEVGFVVGSGNAAGRPIHPDEAADHVFGVLLVTDWSARDLQAFEYQPLGPFLAKSFLTTVSPWVVPLAALAPHLVGPPAQEPPPDPFLRAERDWALDLELAVDLNGTTTCRTGFAGLYWTFAQQLAHLTSNGATTRPGDLFASGTVSGPARGEAGCLMEATRRGTEPLVLADGQERAWLLDGDTVTITGWAGGADGSPRIGLAEAVGTVVPARPTRDHAPARSTHAAGGAP